MRRLLSVFVALAFVVPAAVAPALPAAAGTTPARPAAGTVLFREDFNGTGLDKSKWNDSWFGTDPNPSNPVNGAEENCYRPQNVTVSGGYLHLAAKADSCLGYNYSSGLVNTNGHFNFTTGTLKARVCLPGGTSTADWPGAWSDGQHWPNDGEIDLVEGLGGHDAWHVHSTSPTQGGTGTITSGCHLFKYKRTATTVTFWYDRVKVGAASATAFARSAHYLIFNLGLSSSISPPIRVPAEMTVDWVEVRSL